MESGNLVTAIVWALLPALLLLAAVYWLDRYEKEPLRLLVIALGLGAFVAPVLTGAIEEVADVPTSLNGGAIVPEEDLSPWTAVIEAAVLGVTLLAVFHLVRHEVDGLLDGLVYGAVVGIGFGAAANFVSILGTDSAGGDASPTLFLSMIASVNHALYAGVIGLALAVARRAATPGLVVAALIGSAVAAGLILLHDYLPTFVEEDTSSALGQLYTNAPNLMGLLVLGALAIWSAAHEAALIGRELEDEVRDGTVKLDEYVTVTNTFRRLAVLTGTLLSRGDDAWRRRRRLYELVVELAFQKHRRRLGRPVAPGMDESTLRREIAATRESLAEPAKPEPKEAGSP